MRILDSEPVIVVSMTRKKQRRHQPQQVQQLGQQQSQNSIDSDEECANTAKHCAHINKSVNPNTVKKSLKKSAFGCCGSCETKADANSDENVVEPSVYMCLQCGHQGCDRSSPGQHALQHNQVAHSQPHDIAVNLSSMAVWCYVCDEFVSTDVSRKLKECIEMIQRHASTANSLLPVKKSDRRLSEIQTPVNSASINPCAGENDQPQSHTVSSSKRTVTASSALSRPQSSGGVCSKVKGLANLGNTCFFNAVVQNLCQTHLLEQQLRDWSTKGYPVELLTNTSHAADPDMECTCDSDCDQNKIETMTVRLSELGPLTQSVLSLFDEIAGCPGGKQHSYVSPSGLFNQVCNKAPRFKGFQQQDSHELLRYMLDGIRAEEIKRMQLAILKSFNLPGGPGVKDLPDEQKLKIKDFGRSAKHTFIDRIFGGVFISAIVCQVCHTPNAVLEPFLDVSLPIIDEKSATATCKQLVGDGSALMGSRLAINDVTSDLILPKRDVAVESQPTKNQLKRQQKLARKQKKKVDTKSTIGKSDCVEATESTVASVDVSEADEHKEAPLAVNHSKDGDCVDTDGADGTKLLGDLESFRNTMDDSGIASMSNHVGMGDAAVNSQLSSRSQSRAASPDMRSDEDSDKVLSEDENKATHFDTGLNNLPDGSLRSLHVNDCGGLCDACYHNRDDNNCVEVNFCNCDNGSSRADDKLVEEVSEVQPKVLLSALSEVGASSRPVITDCDPLEKGNHVQENMTDARVSSLLPFDQIKLSDGDERMSPHSFQSASVDSFHSVTAIESNSAASFSSETCGIANIPYSSDKTNPELSSVAAAVNKSSGDCSSSSSSSRQLKSDLRRQSILQAMVTAAPRCRSSAASRECSLTGCLSQFTAVEMLTGSNMLSCSTCNSNAKQKNAASDGTNGTGNKATPILSCASKQLLIFSPPAVLTIHLKRFQQVGYNLRKNSQHVEFSEILDLAPYCSSYCQSSKRNEAGHAQILYSLYGVIEHSGTLRSGHYTAYVKVRPTNPNAKQFLQLMNSSSIQLSTVDQLVFRMQSLCMDITAQANDVAEQSSEGRWYHISDTSVSEVRNIENVLNCQAYILFYERLS